MTKPWEIKSPDMIIQIYWAIKCCRFYSLTGSFKKVDIEREKKELVFMGSVKNLCSSALNKPNDIQKRNVLRLANRLGVVKVHGVGPSFDAFQKDSESEIVFK